MNSLPVFRLGLISLVGIGGMGIFLAAILTSFLNGVVGFPLGEPLYHAFSAICHQIPSRSFWLFGHPLPICTRCLGGYLAVALGCATLLAIKDSRKVNPWQVYSIAMTMFVFAIIDGIIKPLDGNIWRFFSGSVGGLGVSLAFLSIVKYAVFTKSQKGEVS